MAEIMLDILFDNGVFSEIDSRVKAPDGSCITGYGEINGVNAYAFLLKTAVSKATCRKIDKLYALARKTGCPVIGIYGSTGLVLDELFDPLEAYGSILRTAARLSGVVPQVTVIAGACLGTAALMANTADVVIAVKDAAFSLTPPAQASVTQAAADGLIDIVCEDMTEAFSEARGIVALLPENNLSPLPQFDGEAPIADGTASFEALADAGSVTELKALYAPVCRTALATLGGMPVGLLSFEGLLNPSSLYKAGALVRLCDAYNLPLVTFADATGFETGKEAQLLTVASKFACDYSSATCVKISVMTKESIGAAYIALAGKGAYADYVLAFEDAVVSPLSPEAAVAFLWGDRLAAGEDRASLEAEYRAGDGSAAAAAQYGAVDEICTPDTLRERLTAILSMLAGKRETTIPRKHAVK